MINIERHIIIMNVHTNIISRYVRGMFVSLFGSSQQNTNGSSDNVGSSLNPCHDGDTGT